MPSLRCLFLAFLTVFAGALFALIDVKLLHAASPPEKLRAFIARANNRYREHPVTAEQMQTLKQAGFNTFVQRWAVFNAAQVEHTLTLCQAHDMQYAAWFRASLPNDSETDRQLVWASGQVQPVHSPLSPALWAYLEESLLTFATYSLSGPCIGVMLDFENYYPNKQANLYFVSYDLYSLREFAQAHQLDAPPADLALRQSPIWVRQAADHHALWHQYEAWFTDQVRERATSLREKIDQINPKFRIMSYLNEGITASTLVPAWGTEAAPYVVLGVDYGRPSPLLDETTALQVVRETVQRRLQQWRERSDCFVEVTGGAMPGYQGSDPEYSAKKVSLISQESDGYWVWFETNFSDEEFNQWMSWYQKANAGIQDGTHAVMHQPRETPEPQRDPTVLFPNRPQVAILGDMRQALQRLLSENTLLEPHRLEGATLTYLQQFQMLVLQNVQIPASARPALEQMLRTYVQEGGSLVLAFRTVGDHGLGNPFPELVREVLAPAAEDSDLFRHRHRRFQPQTADLLSAVLPPHYSAHYSLYQAFKPGPDGRVLTTDHQQQAVAIYGTFGRGQVLITGDHLGRRQPPTGPEAEFLKHLFTQLAESASRQAAG